MNNKFLSNKKRVEILKFFHAQQLKNLKITFDFTNSEDYISYALVDLTRKKTISHTFPIFDIENWIKTYKKEVLEEIENFKKD